VEFKLLNFIEDAGLAIDKATWFTLDRTYFESGSSTLKAESKDQPDRLAAILKAYPAVSLKIGGYTDNTGSDAYNMVLSSERAEAAKEELVNRGIAENRLTTEGYGSQHPVFHANETPECKAQNRRIDVWVNSK
jgi:outer membrane protein OmpA-like peptidoglycan-associated protein